MYTFIMKSEALIYHKHVSPDVTVFIYLLPPLRLIVATGCGFFIGIDRLEFLPNIFCSQNVIHLVVSKIFTHSMIQLVYIHNKLLCLSTTVEGEDGIFGLINTISIAVRLFILLRPDIIDLAHLIVADVPLSHGIYSILLYC